MRDTTVRKLSHKPIKWQTYLKPPQVKWKMVHTNSVHLHTNDHSRHEWYSISRIRTWGQPTRQWWRRLVAVKGELHAKHWVTALSSLHVTDAVSVPSVVSQVDGVPAFAVLLVTAALAALAASGSSSASGEPTFYKGDVCTARISMKCCKVYIHYSRKLMQKYLGKLQIIWVRRRSRQDYGSFCSEGYCFPPP